MNVVIVSQGPQFEPLPAPYRLITGYAATSREIAEACRFSHNPIRAFPDMNRQDFMAECWRQATSILDENPSVVGLSMYCWNSSNLLTIARLIKAQQPDVTVVAGGPDTYGEGAALLGRNPALDVVLGGEGEVAFLRFLEAVLDGSSMADVPFATYRSGDQIVTSDKVDYIADLDNIPSAILGASKDEMGTRLGREEDVATIMETSRGCPINCAFCQYPRNDDGRMRYYSMDRVMAELEAIRLAGIRGVYFADGILTIKKERAYAVFEYFLNVFTDGRLHTEIKLDIVPDLVIDQIRELCDQGRIDFGVGLQSVNRTTLRNMGRPTSLDRVAKNARKIGSGARIRWDLIYGLPGDTYDDLLDGMDYIMSVQPGALMAIQPLQVLPGTEYRARASVDGLIFDEQNPYIAMESRTFSRGDMRMAETASQLTSLFWTPIHVGLGSHGTSADGMFGALLARPELTATSWLVNVYAFARRLREWFSEQVGTENMAAIDEHIDTVVIDSLKPFEEAWPHLASLPTCIAAPAIHPVSKVRLVGTYAFRFDHVASDAGASPRSRWYRVLSPGSDQSLDENAWARFERN